MNRMMYIADNINSFFDNPERSSLEGIESDKEFISGYKIVTKMLDSFPNAALILNQNRQIVAYNANVLNLLPGHNYESIYGKRVGEALGCIHAFEMPAGCGTSIFCTECGAAKCNKTTLESSKDCSQECRITIENNDAEASLDLRVTTSILELEQNRYMIFAIEDIQNEKRRKVLERIFFHDVLNTATAILGVSEIINSSESLEEINEFKPMIYKSSEQLVKEIMTQRDLVNAETGSLSVNLQINNINGILSTAYGIYKDHKLAVDKTYLVEFVDSKAAIETDPVLMTRVIGNLIKNALEATKPGGVVKLYSIIKEHSIEFLVYNDGYIPENIQIQIFQRSFSTKASSGRGIGTYSVKLLVEQYLNGKVSFTSGQEEGTIFKIEIKHNKAN